MGSKFELRWIEVLHNGHAHHAALPHPQENGLLKQLRGSTAGSYSLLQLHVQLLGEETTATLSAKRSGALYPLDQLPISRRGGVSANAIARAWKCLQVSQHLEAPDVPGS